jgi:uncharacterized protein (DUF302 family)
MNKHCAVAMAGTLAVRSGESHGSDWTVTGADRNSRRRWLVLSVTAASIAVVSMISAAATEVRLSDPAKLKSAYPFRETVERLRTALEGKGFTVFAEIDQQRAANSVGLQMPPTVLLIYGNPKGGTPLMLAAPDFGLELPLKVLVREENEERVLVVYKPAATLDGCYGLPPGLAAKLAAAEPTIKEAVGSMLR